MNKLKPEKQVAVISALVEGASIRSVERMTGVHRDTIMRLMVRVGNACEAHTDGLMRDLPCRRIEVDEVWTFVGKKQRHLSGRKEACRFGDFFTWVALDADTKLVPAYRVSKRDGPSARAFIRDLASRLRNRVQLTSDALHLYVEAVEESFGADVDYAQLVKSYEAEWIGPGRYSPPKVTATEKIHIVGRPHVDAISTSYVERHNLTMRMQVRRFTRLTNGFSKKLENLRAAVSLHYAHYNLVRLHRSVGMTPAMAAGVADDFWSVDDLVALAEWG